MATFGKVTHEHLAELYTAARVETNSVEKNARRELRRSGDALRALLHVINDETPHDIGEGYYDAQLDACRAIVEDVLYQLKTTRRELRKGLYRRG